MIGIDIIDIKKFGLAWGLTGALRYMGCVLLMMAAEGRPAATPVRPPSPK